MNSLTLNIPSVLKLTDEQFEQLAAANGDLRLELTAKGELIIMPPTGGETGDRNFELDRGYSDWTQGTCGRSSAVRYYFNCYPCFRVR